MISFIQQHGDTVRQTEDKLFDGQPILDGVEFVVSFGYRHLLKDWFLARFSSSAINLHASLLPFNRGADPNLWSFLEDTPKGVTIHSIDRGIDTGMIIAQREVALCDSDTLRSSYERLTMAMESLFRERWPSIRSGEAPRSAQPPGGSYHRMKDKEPFLSLLTDGWDTPVRKLIGRALVQERSEG